jgi:hypothetical protein
VLSTGSPYAVSHFTDGQTRYCNYSFQAVIDSTATLPPPTASLGAATQAPSLWVLWGFALKRRNRRQPRKPGPGSSAVYVVDLDPCLACLALPRHTGPGQATPSRMTYRANRSVRAVIAFPHGGQSEPGGGVAPVALAARHRLSDGVPTGGACILCKSFSHCWYAPPGSAGPPRLAKASSHWSALATGASTIEMGAKAMAVAAPAISNFLISASFSCPRKIDPAKVATDALEDSQRLLGKFLGRIAGRILLPFSRTRGRFCNRA